ncbi:MAG: hypothetical protein FWF18_03150 [Dehalococcoidia bacterium]|nr:hypothetical protein [Dehalococcoidia bacterium]
MDESGQLSVMNFDQVHPVGSAATEGSGGEVPVTTPHPSRCFVTCKLVPPAWIYSPEDKVSLSPKGEVFGASPE